MNKIIIWEDLNIETNIATGMTEEVDPEELEELEGFEEINPQQIITSPFGIFHVQDFFNPMRQYNWHQGHFNFDITKSVVNKLSKIPGVEKIVVSSRYRLIIAIGKAFQQNLVKKDIYEQLEASPPLSEEALLKKKDLEDIYEKWAIYFLDNKDWEYCTEENFEEKIEDFRNMQKKMGGIVITHETEF